MSQAPPPPHLGDPPPAKSGGRFFMFGGIGCGLVLLVCCGAVGFGVYWASKSFTTDPAKIAEIRDSMVPIDIPPGYSGEFGMQFIGMTMVFYSSDTHNGAIMQGEFGPQYAGNDARELQAQVQTQMGNRSDEADVNFTEFETRVYTIFGEEREFEFALGQDPNTGMEYLRVMGTYPVEGGSTGLLFIQAPTDEMSAEQADLIVRSIDPAGTVEGGIPLDRIEVEVEEVEEPATDETPATDTPAPDASAEEAPAEEPEPASQP